MNCTFCWSNFLIVLHPFGVNMNRNTRAAILSCLKPTSTAWHSPTAWLPWLSSHRAVQREYTLPDTSHTVCLKTPARTTKKRAAKSLQTRKGNSILRFPQSAVLPLCEPWMGLQCEYAPPTNQSTHYVTRAQLVCHQNHLLILIVFLASRGPVFVLPACSYLLRPVSTWVSLAQLTVQPRKLGNKDFFGFSAFPSDSSCSSSGEAFAKAQFDYSEDSAFYAKHSVNYRNSFVQRNLKSCSN